MDKKKTHSNWRPVGAFPSIAAAALKFGMHPSTLAGRLRREWPDWDALNIPVGPSRYRNTKKWRLCKQAWLKKQSLAKELRLAGLTYGQIAEILGCSSSKVRDFLKREIPAYS